MSRRSSLPALRLWRKLGAMSQRHHAFAIALFLASCASGDDGKARETTPPTTPTETRAPESDATPAAPTLGNLAIASVQLAQNCPPFAAAPTAGATASSDEPMPSQSRSRRAPGNSFVAPCTQSSMQLAFSGPKTTDASFAIKGIRLIASEGTFLADLASRTPTIWQDGGYVPWDGKVTPATEHKASYKLSVPDWAVVEKTLGKGSYGTMFKLEVDVEFAGKTTTLTSPTFERAQSLMIRT